MDYTKTANKGMAKKGERKTSQTTKQFKEDNKVLFIIYHHFRPLSIYNPASIGTGWPDSCAIGSPEAHHYPLKINLILKISALLKYLHPVFLIGAYWEM
jgi:hypothetical protein